jgi:membrane-bound ClpP family serine protease
MVRYPLKIIIRYSVLQLPGAILLIAFLLIIRNWVYISPLVFWGVIIIWISKDIVLFFYTWTAYDWEQKDRMINAYGTALETISDVGYILVNGEKWKAELVEGEPALEKGQRVLIKGRKGLILEIAHVDNGREKPF